MSIKARTESISPSKAAMWLKQSAGNRSLNRGRIAFLAMQMKEGKFHENGQPIIFGDNGLLYDGHHRLNAIVMANVSVKLLVARGISAEARRSIDQGMRWTAGHFMQADGEKQSTTLARAAREFHFYQKDPTRLFWGGGAHMSPHSATADDICRVLEKNPGLRASLDVANGCRELVSHGTLTFLHYVYARRFGRARIDEMVDKFIKGDELRLGSPLLVVRKRLMKAKLTRISRGIILHGRVATAYLIYAFNAYLEGRSMVKLGRRNLDEMPKVTSKKASLAEEEE